MFYIFQLRISLALLLIAACGLTADVGKGGDKHGTQIVTVESEILRSARKKAFALYSNQQYEEAIDAYLHARELALSEKNYALANHFLNNVAGSYFALASYQNATKYFNLAVAEARRHQFPQLETMAAYNIASIHLALGQAGQALEVLRQFPLDGSSMGRDAKLDGLLLQGNVLRA